AILAGPCSDHQGQALELRRDPLRARLLPLRLGGDHPLLVFERGHVVAAGLDPEATGEEEIAPIPGLHADDLPDLAEIGDVVPQNHFDRHRCSPSPLTGMPSCTAATPWCAPA